VEIGRFAPSATGLAHPGTLLAALLCWLDARARPARIVLRLEDLDSDRCRPHYADALCADLEWLGLTWDSVARQSDAAERYARALDQLASQGLLYPCRCSRAEIRAAGAPVAGGGSRYPNTCRARSLPAEALGGWRATSDVLRVRLPDARVEVIDESGVDLSENPFDAFGDPIVRRRDGAPAYHLASVVDDAASGVTRIVRGRDLAPHTPTQIAVQQLLGLPRPVYRHHLLLLESRGEKLAKLHGSVSLPELRGRYDARALCGVLAHAAGLRPGPDPVTPADLLSEFAWQRVAHEDRVLDWDGQRLSLGAATVRAPAC
jgi:glutamyl-tRNA synthetase/glutamyl-Q tRNA(Asp) synthetase